MTCCVFQANASCPSFLRHKRSFDVDIPWRRLNEEKPEGLVAFYAEIKPEHLGIEGWGYTARKYSTMLPLWEEDILERCETWRRRRRAASNQQSGPTEGFTFCCFCLNFLAHLFFGDFLAWTCLAASRVQFKMCNFFVVFFLSFSNL